MTGDWRAALKADPTNWLLEEENPSVRYFTLKDILDRPEKIRRQTPGGASCRPGLVPDAIVNSGSRRIFKPIPDFKPISTEALSGH